MINLAHKTSLQYRCPQLLDIMHNPFRAKNILSMSSRREVATAVLLRIHVRCSVSQSLQGTLRGFISLLSGKGKVVLVQVMRVHRGVKIQLHSFFTSALPAGVRSALHPSGLPLSFEPKISNE